jgi:glycerol-3-phosphate dehydrogenase
MRGTETLAVDVLIFGGGVAGLWLLDRLRRVGLEACLLECHRLGEGQTVGSQGIIHGGIKYALDGLMHPRSDAIRDMPGLWRDCLAGRRQPHLARTRVRADDCHLWRTTSLRSQAGMLGARLALRVRPEPLPPQAWPTALRECPGEVYRLGEPVLDPVSLLRDLADRQADAVLRYDLAGLDIETERPGVVRAVQVHDALDPARKLRLHPGRVVLAAGAGNAELRERAGLRAAAMQRRPLHMVLVRGELPLLNGHCTDGARTRVTITTDADAAGRSVWQVGGQVAEDGVGMSTAALIARAQRELRAVLPSIDFRRTEWATYRVDRAEGRHAGGRRPADVDVLDEGNVITAWPTKLALAPRLADRIAGSLSAPRSRHGFGPPEARASRLEHASLAQIAWTRPSVAPPPWETQTTWTPAD